MTDQECAAVIRRVLNNDDYVHLDDELAAYKRAIEVLEWMQQYEIDEAKFGAGGEWS